MNYVHVGLSLLRAKVCGSMRERRCVCVHDVRVGAVVIQRERGGERQRERERERERDRERERENLSFSFRSPYRLFAHGTERKTGVAKLDPWSKS